MGIVFFVLIVVYVIGGFDNVCEGLIIFFEEKEFDVDLLMIVVVLGVVGLGFWWWEYIFIVDGVVLIFIFVISGVLEGYVM